MVEDLKLFQARQQVFLKQFLKRKFGVHFPPISLRTRSVFRLHSLRYLTMSIQIHKVYMLY